MRGLVAAAGAPVGAGAVVDAGAISIEACAAAPESGAMLICGAPVVAHPALKSATTIPTGTIHR